VGPVEAGPVKVGPVKAMPFKVELVKVELIKTALVEARHWVATALGSKSLVRTMLAVRGEVGAKSVGVVDQVHFIVTNTVANMSAFGM
jgi:hypothetical protein